MDREFHRIYCIISIALYTIAVVIMTLAYCFGNKRDRGVEIRDIDGDNGDNNFGGGGGDDDDIDNDDENTNW